MSPVDAPSTMFRSEPGPESEQFDTTHGGFDLGVSGLRVPVNAPRKSGRLEKSFGDAAVGPVDGIAMKAAERPSAKRASRKLLD